MLVLIKAPKGLPIPRQQIFEREGNKIQILKDLISSLKEDAPVKEVRTCVFWTAVVSKNCGLASTTTDLTVPHSELPVREVGELTQKGALELANFAFSERLLEATIGMAAVNSLIEIDESKCVELNAREVLLEKGKGKKVAIIGHFPFVPQIEEVAEELWIFEKRPGPGDLPETETAKILPQAEIVAITGTTFINHTIQSILQLCSPQAFKIVLGPTTPLSPVLFDYGVDIISGIKVIDPETVLHYISQGATFRQMKGVKLLTLRK